MKSYHFNNIPDDIMLYLKMEAARREMTVSEVLIEMVKEHRNQGPPYYDIPSMIEDNKNT